MSIKIGIGLGIPFRRGGGVGIEIPMLDTYTAMAAFSFRKLRTAYAGNCIKVRRDSDDGTQDIGFVGGMIDTASLLTFVGVGNGYIDTLYDQGVNGLDLNQPITTRQPLIVIAGVLCTYNGRPIAICDGVDDGLYRLNIAQTANVGFIGMFLVHRNREIALTGNKVYAIVTTGISKQTTRTSIGRGIVFGKYFHNCRRLDADSTDYYNSVTDVDLTQKLITTFADFTNGDGFIFLNGTPDNSDTTFGTEGSTSNTSSQNMSIGGVVYDGADAYEVNCDFFEWIVFNTDISASRVAIETNQANHFNFSLGAGDTILSGEVTYDSSIDAI